VVWDLPSTAVGAVNIDFTNTQNDPTPMMNTTDRAIRLVAGDGVVSGATVNISVTANYLTPSVDDATTPLQDGGWVGVYSIHSFTSDGCSWGVWNSVTDFGCE